MNGLSALRAWLADLWRRASAPVEMTEDEAEWAEEHWQIP